MKLTILGGLLNISVSLVGRFIPTIGYWTMASYTDTSVPDYSQLSKAYDPGQAGREPFLMTFGRNLSLWISNFKSPLKAILHPVWGVLVLVTIVATTLSGFRNAVVMIGFTYIVGLLYRGGVIHLVIFCLMGILVASMLAIINMAAPLPPNIQRALSFLPGTWEQRYVDDAEGSSEWRVEIWREALLTDRWIQNKWLGDGLGFSSRELAYQTSLRDGGLTTRGIS